MFGMEFRKVYCILQYVGQNHLSLLYFHGHRHAPQTKGLISLHFHVKIYKYFK